MSEDYTRIKVILRIRPAHKQEQQWFKNQEYKPIMRPSDQTESPDTRVIIDSSNKSYDYDKIFRDDCTQKQIFREAALPTLDNVFKGYCGAVMAYGQTGTGKTHTMQGYDRSYEGEERGIIPRCAEWIFNRVEREKPNWKITITLMFVQIYLDKLQDLFKPDAPEVNIDPESERVELPGITQKEVRSTEEFMKAYFWGEQHRVTRATLMNPTSSRGHAALLVNVRLEPHDVSQATRVGKLVLVDLAGYERFAQTGITTGIAAEEAKKINASLLALGSVVNALAEKQKHIPYRNAKLTRLLKDCLGGTSKSTIVLTIGPCDKYKQETAGTLYFGWRAMAVKVNARIREEFDPTKYIQNLKDKLSEANQHLVKMVRFIKSMPGAFEKYVEKNGEPPQLAGIADDDDDEQGEILSALTRMPSRKMSRAATMAQLKAAETGVPAPQSLVSMPTEELLQDELVENPDAPVEVRRVQQTWNEELRAHQEQMKSELEMLRLRHIQDLEEARAAGVSEDVLMRLREEHEEELRLVQEQNKVLKEEILRQKQREEAKALLQSSMATMAAAEAQTGPASEVVKQDDARIKEMVTHLQETCSNKDEILVRLFDLICLREAEVKDYEINASAIAMATADDVVQHNSATLTEARREIEHLRGELSRKNAEIERMKKVSTTTSTVASSTGQQSPPHPSHSNVSSIPSNPNSTHTSTPSHPTPALVREHSHSMHAITPSVSSHPTPVVAHQPTPQVPTGHRASVSHINIPTQPQPAPVPNQARSKSQDFTSAGYNNLMPRGYPPTPQQTPQVITRPYSGPPATPQPHSIPPRGAPFVPTGATAAPVPYQQSPYRGPPYGPNTYSRQATFGHY